MGPTAPTEPARGRDHLLEILALALAISTALAVLAPAVGLGHPSAGQRIGGFGTWDGLAWILLLAGGLWRSRTHIRRLRTWLASTDTKLADLTATTHDWVWESDSRLTVISCGPSVLRLLGRSPSEVIGHSMLEFLDPA